MSAEATAREEELLQLIRQPESQTLEFKSYTPDASAILRQLSAFANTDGGTMVIGVKEGGEVVGIHVARLLRAVEHARKVLNPPQQIRLDIPTVNGKQIGIIRIERSGEAPVFADAGAFIRKGESSLPMPADDLRRRLEQLSEQHAEESLAIAIANQTALIETLRLELREAHAWKNKMKDYVIGGVVGALLGAITSLVVK